MAGTVQGNGGVGKNLAIGCGCIIVMIVLLVVASGASYVVWLLKDMFLPNDGRDDRQPISNTKMIDRAYEKERLLDADIYDQAANEEIDIPQELLKAHKRAFVEVQRNLKRSIDKNGRERAYRELATETRRGRRRAEPDPQPQESRQPAESQPLQTIPQRQPIQRPGQLLLEEK